MAHATLLLCYIDQKKSSGKFMMGLVLAAMIGSLDAATTIAKEARGRGKTVKQASGEQEDVDLIAVVIMAET